ncbi:CehA/McbA family metallohydrolase [Bradyrhizobium erythrophlei]|uniref:Uncharacterized protein n=1 Tax=Bradyrhizobium erythrophlei TaxID=1437360 RepID=A0A1H4UKI7_9BRAD|nr:CehA/McbA family metallohydrolase [Bradyrhizobium erythrophlei]SEC69185.1 hypothetical protein SAMN05444164_2490 [Bradyrhizobium erythrophlei]
MFVERFRSRRSQALFLTWVVRAMAATAIAMIGLFQFVLGNGFSFNTIVPSYLSASLNFGRTDQGKFELSLAIQPHQGSAAGTVVEAVATGGNTTVPAKIAAALPRADAALSSVNNTPVNAGVGAVRPVPDDEPVSCALPAPAKRASSDGQLMLVSFSTGTGRIDGYGVNDTALSPNLDRHAGYSLPVLEWFRHQGALSGYRHAATDKAPRSLSRTLPNFLVSAVDEGTGDYVMSVAHDAVDFITVGTGDFSSELNLWYHSLNAGFRTRIIGEMPCAAAEAPPMNGVRSNIQSVSILQSRRTMLSTDMAVSERRTAIHEFKVDGRAPSHEVGSEVRLPSTGNVAVSASLAVSLDEKRAGSAEPRPGWNVENARIGDTRLVNVEVVVNGRVAANKTIIADGTEQKVDFSLPIQQSSWLAIRIKGAAHTNPVFVLVDNMPVRGSRASVEWIMRSLLEAYEVANPRWTEKESANARAAYGYSYAVYQKRLAETKTP